MCIFLLSFLMFLALVVLLTLQLNYLHETTSNKPGVLLETKLQLNAEVL